MDRRRTGIMRDGAASPRQVVSMWVVFDGSTGTIIDSEGVTSVVRNSAGDYTVTWSRSFASVNYGCLLMPSINLCAMHKAAPTTGGITILVHNAVGAATDSSRVNAAAFGEV